MPVPYVPVKARTVDTIVDEKMIVLEELCVVDRKNEKDIRARLYEEIRKYPGTDPDIVVDRMARTLISKRFE